MNTKDRTASAVSHKALYHIAMSIPCIFSCNKKAYLSIKPLLKTNRYTGKIFLCSWLILLGRL